MKLKESGGTMLYVLVGGVMLIALVAIGAAIFVMLQQKKRQRAMPVETVLATVKKCREEVSTRSNSYSGSASVDEKQNVTVRRYYIDFAIDSRKKKTVAVKEKMFREFLVGQQGTLTYQGDRLMSFKKELQKQVGKESYFFQRKVKRGSTAKFYGMASILANEIFSTEALDCDCDEVLAYVDRMLENDDDNFIVLESKFGQVLQLSNNGQNNVIEIEVPVENNEAWRKQTEDLSEIKDCIRSFFNGTDIIRQFDLIKEEH